MNGGEFLLNISQLRFQLLEFIRQLGNRRGRIEQNQADDGDDPSVFPKRNPVKQKTGIFEMMEIVDFYDAGFGRHGQTAVGDDLGRMFAERGFDVYVQKTGVGPIDVYDLAVRVASAMIPAQIRLSVVTQLVAADPPTLKTTATSGILVAGAIPMGSPTN